VEVKWLFPLLLLLLLLLLPLLLLFFLLLLLLLDIRLLLLLLFVHFLHRPRFPVVEKSNPNQRSPSQLPTRK